MYAIWQLDDPCETASVGGTFVENGITFIKLKDNKCWTKSSQGTTTWANAASKCPSGTSLPTPQNFVDLITAYGGAKNTNYGTPYGWYDGDNDLYKATGWGGSCAATYCGHWSSMQVASNTSYAWRLAVDPSYSNVHYNSKTNYDRVVCIKS